MTDHEILDIALANGFKLKEQPDGSWSLNPYVWQFAKAIEERAAQEPVTVIDGFIKQEPSSIPTSDEHNALLVEQIEELRERIDEYKGDIALQRKAIEQVDAEKIALETELNDLRDYSGVLEEEIAALKSKIEFLSDDAPLSKTLYFGVCLERDALKAEVERLKSAPTDEVVKVLEECVPPLEIYKAYGWPDRDGVIGKAKVTLKKVKP